MSALLLLAAFACSDYKIRPNTPEPTGGETDAPGLDTEAPADTAPPLDTAPLDTGTLLEDTSDGGFTTTPDTDDSEGDDTGDPPPGPDAKTRGASFWLGFTENLDLLYNGPPEFSILVDTPADASGVIELPATGYTQSFATTGGVTEEVMLPAAIFYPEGSEAVADLGIRVTVDTEADVRAVHYRAYFTDASQLLPEEELGRRYRVVAGLDERGFNPSQFLVVATADGTTATITPSTLTRGVRPEGVPFEVTLDAGQVYQVQAYGDLSGSLIEASAPVAVFAGALQAYINGSAADSHIWDQIYPEERMGQAWALAPFSGQGGDLFRVVADADATALTLDGAALVTLDEGEVYDLRLSLPALLESSAPVAVAQFNDSQDANRPSNIGDPSMLALVPASLTTQRAPIYSTGRRAALGFVYSTVHFATVTRLASAAAPLLLDGADVSEQCQPFPANPAWVSCALSLDAGSHELTSDDGFQARVYGFGDYDAYTFWGGYDCEGCAL